MEHLTQMKSVPISFEYGESKHPHTISKSTANLQITQGERNLDIKSSPVRFKMDVFSKGNGDIARGEILSYTATAGFDGSGNMRLNVNLAHGDTRALRLAQVGRDFAGIAARTGKSIPLDSSQLAISFNLKGISGIDANTRFTPPDLQLGTDDKSQVYLSYAGEPLYFPQSADPNYEPIEVQEAPARNYFPISSDPNYEPPAVDLVGPHYFPKSADPNYEAPKVDLPGAKYFPKSADPNYEAPADNNQKASNPYNLAELSLGFKAQA